MFLKGRAIGMLEFGRSQTEVSQILNVPQVCDFITEAMVSKCGRCYPTTSTRSTKSNHRSRPIFGNNCVTGVVLQNSVQRLQLPQEYEFQGKLFIRNSIMLVYMPDDQPFAFFSHLRINAKHQYWSLQQWVNVMFSVLVYSKH